MTLKGGPAEPHITDSTGLPLASDYTWSFTTAAAPPPVTGVSIWDDSVIPPTPIFPDSAPVEVGLKFRSDKGGLVTGVRFYKGGAANGGTHVGHLWTSTGILLGTVTFTDESDTGWQRALFATPVLIAANTFYVVSYFAPQGNYAADGGFFASSGVTTDRCTHRATRLSAATAFSTTAGQGGSHHNHSTQRTTGWTWYSLTRSLYPRRFFRQRLRRARSIFRPSSRQQPLSRKRSFP